MTLLKKGLQWIFYWRVWVLLKLKRVLEWRQRHYSTLFKGRLISGFKTWKIWMLLAITSMHWSQEWILIYHNHCPNNCGTNRCHRPRITDSQQKWVLYIQKILHHNQYVEDNVQIRNSKLWIHLRFAMYSKRIWIAKRMEGFMSGYPLTKSLVTVK